MEMLVNKTHIDPNQSTPLHKNADNASTKENADNSEDNSSIKSRDINSKSKRPTVIWGDSMLKHLNSWEMSKKVKSDCKIFVKHFSGATTNCMKDYMKPSLRKDPNQIVLHVGTKRPNPREDFARHCNLDRQSSVFNERRKLWFQYIKHHPENWKQEIESRRSVGKYTPQRYV